MKLIGKQLNQILVVIAFLFLAQPAISQESPNDTRVPPAASITDSAGDVWSFGVGGAVLRNSVAVGGAGSELLYCNHIVHAFGTDSNWYRWAGSWTLNGTVDPCASFEESPHLIYFDPNGNTGFGTQTPIFNDDGVTGANVGKYFAVDGVVPGGAAYIGVGGNVTNLNDRVGQYAFYNWAQGGVDHRTAFIQSGNDGVLGRGYLELATSPDNVSPLVRMRIGSDGTVRIGNPWFTGGTVGVTALPGQSLIQTWFNNVGVPVASVLNNGKLYLRSAGAPIILKAPNGKCFEKSIDNDGNWVTVPVTPCPP
ncbi:MAG TPA: hypothetical protein VJV03_11010 [Pyrinomonadaceae bacterium]|nr:hypothetical protein [Pyrinomonadaceae bacterium]